jgi:hypothetical protein
MLPGSTSWIVTLRGGIESKLLSVSGSSLCFEQQNRKEVLFEERLGIGFLGMTVLHVSCSGALVLFLSTLAKYLAPSTLI